MSQTELRTGKVDILYESFLYSNIHSVYSSSSYQMPRYQRTEFDEDRRSVESDVTTPLDGTVIFPPDITKGFSNPNSDFDVVFKSSDVDHDLLAETSSSMHPMVNIQRPTSSSRKRSSLRFFTGKLLRPLGINLFPSSSSSGSSTSRRASFMLWSRMTFLEKILFTTSILLSVIVILLTLSLIQRNHQLLPYNYPYYNITPAVRNATTKGKVQFVGQRDPTNSFTDNKRHSWDGSNFFLYHFLYRILCDPSLCHSRLLHY